MVRKNISVGGINMLHSAKQHLCVRCIWSKYIELSKHKCNFVRDKILMFSGYMYLCLVKCRIVATKSDLIFQGASKS